jgi:sulfatase modifying factor 1
MKSKTLLLVFLALIGISCIVDNRSPVITDMVLVNQGIFMRGIDSVQLQQEMIRFNKPASFFSTEFPAMRTFVSSFYIDKYAVTNAQYKKFIEANPQWSKANLPDSLQNSDYLKNWNSNKYPKGQANCPVVYVSWFAANAYAHWVGKRLPMAVELEYAANGTQSSSSIFPWGNADADVNKANYLESGIGHARQVGKYPANGLGLYDLAGNVSEFCVDKWHQNLHTESALFKKNTYRPFTNLPADKNKVEIRGGSWKDPAISLRVTYREGILATDCNAFVGFRCAAGVRTAINPK